MNSHQAPHDHHAFTGQPRQRHSGYVHATGAWHCGFQAPAILTRFEQPINSDFTCIFSSNEDPLLIIIRRTVAVVVSYWGGGGGGGGNSECHIGRREGGGGGGDNESKS